MTRLGRRWRGWCPGWDGMPLAIELAAARLDVLGVAQLLEGIDERFELLTDGDRLAGQRQR